MQDIRAEISAGMPNIRGDISNISAALSNNSAAFVSEHSCKHCMESHASIHGEHDCTPQTFLAQIIWSGERVDPTQIDFGVLSSKLCCIMKIVASPTWASKSIVASPTWDVKGSKLEQQMVRIAKEHLNREKLLLREKQTWIRIGCLLKEKKENL